MTAVELWQAAPGDTIAVPSMPWPRTMTVTSLSFIDPDGDRLLLEWEVPGARGRTALPGLTRIVLVHRDEEAHAAREAETEAQLAALLAATRDPEG